MRVRSPEMFVRRIQHPGPPRPLLEAWITVLLAPLAWLGALGVLYSLADASCARTRHLPAALALACLVLTIAPAPFAWLRRRRIPADSTAGERARFLFQASVGLSALFAVVTLLSAIPIYLLDPCAP